MTHDKVVYRTFFKILPLHLHSSDTIVLIRSDFLAIDAETARRVEFAHGEK